ncbi:MAG: type II toxin-antitoxin system Phd/YefM family antitoxin [Sphaerochaetaceae bacterium]|nr:type II toxin-antitoxin system Phd/YefM family antitoxin [Sphaerochaetaceae bacterium]
MKKNKKPMEHFNIAEFNRGQGSKIIRHTSEDDSVAFIQKNGKPLAILISNERYERLLAGGIDINDF